MYPPLLLEGRESGNMQSMMLYSSMMLSPQRSGETGPVSETGCLVCKGATQQSQHANEVACHCGILIYCVE